MEGEDQSGDIGTVAATIDLLAHEYGWSVETILALPMNQLRRTIRAIRWRKKMKAEAWKTGLQGNNRSSSSTRPGRTIDLSTDFESAVQFGRKNKLAIRDK